MGITNELAYDWIVGQDAAYRDRHGGAWRFGRSLWEILREWYFSVKCDRSISQEKKDELWTYIAFWSQYMAINLVMAVRKIKAQNAKSGRSKDTEPTASRALCPTPEPLPQ